MLFRSKAFDYEVIKAGIRYLKHKKVEYARLYVMHNLYLNQRAKNGWSKEESFGIWVRLYSSLVKDEMPLLSSALGDVYRQVLKESETIGSGKWEEILQGAMEKNKVPAQEMARHIENVKLYEAEGLGVNSRDNRDTVSSSAVDNSNRWNNGMPEEEELKFLIDRMWRENPCFLSLLRSSPGIDRARQEMRAYLDVVDWEWRDCAESGLGPALKQKALGAIDVLRDIIAESNEQAIGVSGLEILWELANYGEGREAHARIEPGFIEEFIHIFRAIQGKSPLNHPAPVFKEVRQRLEKMPSGLKGREMGKYYSGLLDMLAKEVNEAIGKIPSGMSPDVIAAREDNRRRILEYFGAEKNDWGSWQWHIQHTVTDSKTLSKLITLTSQQRKAIDIANEYKLPFKITPYYVSLMDFSPSGADRAEIGRASCRERV